MIEVYNVSNIENLVLHAAIGDVENVHIIADGLRNELIESKGLVRLSEKKSLRIAPEALELYLQDVIAETERIQEVAEPYMQEWQQHAWESFHASFSYAAPELTKENVEALLKHPTMGKTFSDGWNRLQVTNMGLLNHLNALYYIEQDTANWQEAWKEFTWIDNFFNIMETSDEPKETLLEMMKTAHDQKKIMLEITLVEQHFEDMLQSRIRQIAGPGRPDGQSWTEASSDRGGASREAGD